MKVVTGWIKDWLGRTMSDEKIVQALEQAGVEVEQYISPKRLDENIVVCSVKKVVQHPGADRLKLVTVELDKDTLQIVCGAPNVTPGMKAALARVGATLPDGDVIRKSKLRGELSEGMLCSELELGLGQDHDGILSLPESAMVGAKLCDIYAADGIVDLKTQANRFDLLSVAGLAREVAAVSDDGLKDLPEPLAASKADGPEVSDGIQAKRLMLARLTVKPGGETPAGMVARLRESGVRAISPIVDVTNYVNLELGQPMHAYDAAKVKLPLTARLAEAGEKLVTLDGVERELTVEDLVIADQNGPVGLAGVMGGASTEVSAETTEILLEAATFEASVVRKMAKRHGLRTEASARFERGLPVQLAPVAMSRAVELLGELSSAKLGAVTDRLQVWPWVQRIGLRRSLLNRLLGFELTVEEAVVALKRLQIEARPFDIAAEVRQHLGKPYVFGAKFKTHGVEAFDCSYLTDYLYSLIGQNIGHTAHEQYQAGRPVELDALQPGDLLFRGGPWHKLSKAERAGVSHVALYVGGGKIVHAVDIERDGKGEWVQKTVPEVREDKLNVMTEDAAYLGARRYVEDLTDFITVPAAPWWRADLKEGQDLVEEVVRMLGYDRVPAKIPAWEPQSVAFDAVRPKQRLLQRVLYGAGLFEVMTYSFVSEEQLTGTGMEPKHHLKLKNPMSSEQAYLRSSLLPSHLTVLGRNRKYAKEVAFYELSKVFVKQRHGEQPQEPMSLAVTLRRPEEAYRHLKGVLDALAWELGVELAVEPAGEAGPFAPGRAGEVKLAGKRIGIIGQLSPVLLRGQKVDGEVAFLELQAGPLLAAAAPRQFAGLSRFPSAQRDLAVLLPAEATWQSVASALAGLNQTETAFVGDYHGGELPAGRKSLTVRLTLTHPDRTPNEAEVAEVERKAMAILKRKLDAEPRS
jgi:phenylalanyl-tRNA synthetase beta subunit